MRMRQNWTGLVTLSILLTTLPLATIAWELSNENVHNFYSQSEKPVIKLSLLNITAIRSNTFMDARLRKLDLSSNMLSSINVTTFDSKGLGQLETLLVNGNNIETIANFSFGQLTSLAHLDLSHNLIQSINFRSLGNLVRLTYLKLSNNLIKTIETGAFSHLRSIATIDLSDNRLKSFNAAVVFWFAGASLKKLNLGNNRLKSFIMSELNFKGLFKLVELDMGGNGLVTIDARLFEPLVKLEVLSLANNSLRLEEERSIFSNLKKLTSLNMAGNDCTKINADIFANLTSLKEVNMAGNGRGENVTLDNRIFYMKLDYFNLCGMRIVNMVLNDCEIKKSQNGSTDSALMERKKSSTMNRTDPDALFYVFKALNWSGRSGGIASQRTSSKIFYLNILIPFMGVLLVHLF